jgi:hypothetical protein
MDLKSSSGSVMCAVSPDGDDGSKTTKAHTRLLLRLAMAVLVVALIAGHGTVLYYFASHTTLAASVIAGAVVLVVVKHLGLLGPLYALLRKVRRRS